MYRWTANNVDRWMMGKEGTEMGMCIRSKIWIFHLPNWIISTFMAPRGIGDNSNSFSSVMHDEAFIVEDGDVSHSKNLAKSGWSAIFGHHKVWLHIGSLYVELEIRIHAYHNLVLQYKNMLRFYYIEVNNTYVMIACTRSKRN